MPSINKTHLFKLFNEFLIMFIIISLTSQEYDVKSARVIPIGKAQ